MASSVGKRVDPLLNHNFVISLLDSNAVTAVAAVIAPSISDVAVGGFSECSGLEMSLKVEDYNEGGRNGAVLHFPSRVNWSNITLKKGLGRSSVLWDWHYGFVQGTGRRRDGTITLLDEQQNPATTWHFRRGLPVKYSGPSLNATQNSVAIESIEISHEGIYQLPLSLGGAVEAVLSAAVSLL